MANNSTISIGNIVIISETITTSIIDRDSCSWNALVKRSRRLIQPSTNIRKPAANITIQFSKSLYKATDTNLPVRVEEEADKKGPSL